MPPEPSPTRRRRSVRHASTPPPARIPVRRPVGWRPALALLPLLCVALGGGTARWSQGIVLAGLGGVLLAMPPRASLGRWLNAALGGLVGLALTAFVPARMFAWPGWRAALTDDFGTALPATLSPQPWLSAEGAVLLVAGLSWFYLMGTMRWTAAERLRAGAFFAAGVVVLAGVFVALFKTGIVVPFWLNERHFGPFPNRNQTADFLAVGALPVLAGVYGGWRTGRRAAAGGWLLGWLVVAVAVFNNFSRAGVGILFGGTAVYLVAEAVHAARRRKPIREVKPGDPLPDRIVAVTRWRRVALAASLMLVLASSFFLFGGDTLGRFQLDPAATGGAESVVTDAFRARIQKDAAAMVAASPWCGVGLNNFAPVFETFRHRSGVPVWLIHPESDWLWMAAELGWPSLALVLAVAALVARWVWPLARGSDRTLRTASALAVALFALHGLVDVSAHRLGTALSAMFLLGLAMPGRGDKQGGETVAQPLPPDARWPVGVFRVLGVVFIGVGALWLLEAGGWLMAPGMEGVTRLKARAALSGRLGDYASAEVAAERALAWAPLDWELYFVRATARVCQQGDPALALADYRRVRYLEPFSGDHCYLEAALWARLGASDLAVSALLEACRREPDRATSFISNVCESAAEGKTVFRERFRQSLRHDPTLQLALLRLLDPPEARRAIADILAANPDLATFTQAQQRAFLRLWAQRGDAAALAAAMEAHPLWQPLGWRWWALACAATGGEERACGIASRYAAPPTVPPPPKGPPRPLAECQADADFAPRDPVAALQLHRALLLAGDVDGALAALHRLTIQPGCPTYFFYLEAHLAGDGERWQEGWIAWEHYLEKTVADE